MREIYSGAHGWVPMITAATLVTFHAAFRDKVRGGLSVWSPEHLSGLELAIVGPLGATKSPRLLRGPAPSCSAV